MVAVGALRIRRGFLIVMALASLAGLTGLALVERIASSARWALYAGPDLRLPALLSISTVERLVGDEVPLTAYRGWSVPPASATVDLSVEVRRVSGAMGWDWITASQQGNLFRIDREGEPFTRFFPEGSNAFILRSFDTGSPLPGRTFRGTVEARSAEGEMVCGTLNLAESGGRNFKSETVCLGSAWSDYSMTWRFPLDALGQTVNIVVNGFRDSPIDLGRVQIEEYDGTTWRPLAPLAPTGVGLVLVLSSGYPWEPGTQRLVRRQIEPTATWQPLEVSVHLTPGKRSRLWAELHVEEGLELEVRNARLSVSAGGWGIWPLSPLFRQALMFGHPNSAAHTGATILLILLSVTMNPWLALLGAALALAFILMTGSRIALLVVLMATVLWLALRGPPVGQKRWNLAVVIAVVAIGVVTIWLVGTGSTRAFQLFGIADRIGIWRTALDALATYPVLGLHGAGLSLGEYVTDNLLGSSLPVAGHAHNLWLELVSAFGLPGLLVALSLTSILPILAWRSARWRGLGLVLSVFVLNVVDYTLFYTGVFLPLLFGLGGLEDL